LSVSGDCDDDNSGVRPSAVEYCDEIDNDCDGDVDEGDSIDATVWYEDYDRDGYGNIDEPYPTCSDSPSAYADNSDDCDDSSSSYSPGSSDSEGDGYDQNCDGVDGIDADGDGYPTSSDCNDSDPEINPGVVNDCIDSVDNDCDGDTDEDEDWSATGGGNHCGKDWEVLATEISGWHYNIGTASITNSSVSDYSSSGLGYIAIQAETISVSGELNAQGVGYPSESGDGAGSPGAEHDAYGVGDLGGGGGGAYGGDGGVGGSSSYWTPSGGAGGESYGSEDELSIELGSGGGSGARAPSYGNGGAGGVGGGVVVLQAELVEVASTGSVIASGGTGETNQYSSGCSSRGGCGGGGSGGGIVIFGDIVSIEGLLSVSGGNSPSQSSQSAAGGGGGGGRIKVFYGQSMGDSTANINVGGGTGVSDGLEGTYYTGPLDYDSTPIGIEP